MHLADTWKRMNKSPHIAADALVVFGVTGDLSYKKIFPSLYSMFLKGKLDMPVIGVASRELSNEQLVQRARSSIEDYGVTVDEDTFSKFAQLLQYVSGITARLIHSSG